VYTSSGGASGVWTQMQKLLASDGAAYDNFGVDVSIYSNVIIVGARLDDDKGTDAGILSLFVLMSIYQYIYIISILHMYIIYKFTLSDNLAVYLIYHTHMSIDSVYCYIVYSIRYI
jgi:hypothetical protein